MVITIKKLKTNDRDKILANAIYNFGNPHINIL